MTTPQMALIEALRQPRCYDHPVRTLELVETHISWVLLTGEYAYKIKKPVNLGFLDFSTLERRQHFCHEELRLNRRLASALYLEVVPVTGTLNAPHMGGMGEPIEYAIKMRQFDQTLQLDRLLAEKRLTRAQVTNAARRLASFHTEAAVAGPDSPFGEPSAVLAPMRENFRQIRPRLPGRAAKLATLESYTTNRFEELQALLARRKQHGFVRECHGDAHLRNMAVLDGEVILFDCIEFNESLRWIDVMSEIAFLTMDLDDRRAPDLAQLCLNTYLAETGDYEGVQLLRFYQVYRALVRAKVESIRLNQGDINDDERQRIGRHAETYLDLALRYSKREPRLLAITHGLSGSGKTTLTDRLLESLPVIRLRSDIERKRLHGLQALESSGSALGTGIYTHEVSEQTYARLADLAMTVLTGGLSVIVDAAFLGRAQRDRFRRLASEFGVAFCILDVRAPPDVLRQRVLARAASGRDASEAGLAVLEDQQRREQPLGADERDGVMVVHGERLPQDADKIATALQRQLMEIV